jgi:hypothetical protein
VKPLATLWTAGVKDEAKANLEQAIRHSTVALGRLYEILEQKENTLISQLTGDSRFDKAWASETAHMLGRLQEIRAQRELLTFIRTNV